MSSQPVGMERIQLLFPASLRWAVHAAQGGRSAAFRESQLAFLLHRPPALARLYPFALLLRCRLPTGGIIPGFERKSTNEHPSYSCKV